MKGNYDYFTVFISIYWGVVAGIWITITWIEKYFAKHCDDALKMPWTEKTPGWYKDIKCKGVACFGIAIVFVIAELIHYLVK